MDVNVSKAAFVVVVLTLMIVVQTLKMAVEVVVHVRVVVMSMFVMMTVQIATGQKTAHEALDKNMVYIRKLKPFHSIPNSNHVTPWMLPDGASARFGRGSVRDIAVSPDGVYLAVATDIGLWWYEFARMQPIALWEIERGMVSTISFSTDGQWIATGNADGVIKVWDVQHSVCVAQMQRDKSRFPGVAHLTFSPDSQRLAATGIRDAIVDVWHPETGFSRAKFYDDEINLRVHTRPVAFSKDSCLLACIEPSASRSSADFICVWDLVHRRCIANLTEHTDFVESLCFSPCNRFLISGGRKGTVRVWDINTWQQHKAYLDYGEFRMRVDYSHEGVLYAVAVSRDTTIVWDVKRGEKCYTYVEEQGNLQSVHFSSDSRFVVAGAHEWAVWTDRNSQSHKFPHLHPTFPDSVAFASDGKTLASGSRNEGIKVWDVATPSQQPICFNPSGKNYSVSISTCGEFHATGIDGNTVNVWKIGKRVPRASFTPSDEKGEAMVAAFSPTSNLLACGDTEGSLHVWDVSSGNKQHLLIHKLSNEGDWIKSVAFSATGKQLVSISNRGPKAQLWDLEGGEEIHEFPGHHIHTVAFSPCGGFIAGSLFGEIRLWAASTYETLLTIRESQGCQKPFALTFSPCGQYLASGESWQRWRVKVPIRLWSVANGEAIASFWGHPTDIQDLAFSSDGALLASGGFDGTILLWDMEPFIGS